MTDERPTLHEIAAMPYPASVEAMRKHYNPHWGEPLPDGGGDRKKYVVTIDYSYRTEETTHYDIIASSKAEAKALARERFDDEHNYLDDLDVDTVLVDEDEE